MAESNTDYPLINQLLPSQWTLYLYDKQLFKKMANRPNFQAKPHRELCTFSTLNDIIYFIQLMEAKSDQRSTPGFISKINMNCNDYIIMRKGIEPLWEDPRNSSGGTFSVKMEGIKGFDVWSTFLIYMISETLMEDMHYINGITVSYISDSYNINSNNKNFTYVKIWDGKPNRNKDEFFNLLPVEISEMIKSESILYTSNNKKKDFNEKSIIGKLLSQKKTSREKGDFKYDNRRKKY
jgi:hypothetical protein